MIRIPGPIPVVIHPTFWLLCLLIGFINGSGNLLQMLVWVGIIFVSVLFHEFGHALTALLFGRHPRIELIALGGVTYHDSQNLKAWKRFLITFNGPLFGFFLAILATIALSIPHLIQNQNLYVIVRSFQVVNIFWTLVNLLPVVPLDGGQLLQIILEKIFGIKGIQYALLTSGVIALAFSLVCFLFQAFLAGAFFFLFAYQGYVSWRQAKLMTHSDTKESVKSLFDQAEKELQEGKKEEAYPLLLRVRKETEKGLLYVLSTQYLALLEYEKGNIKDAYELLLPLQGQISGDALNLLHLLAFEMQNYPLVVALSASSYETAPNIATALRNASAAAALGQVEPTIGWLETAHQEGLQNLKEIVNESTFDPVRQHVAFQAFLSTIE